jgi:hypothetical protein
MQSVAPLSRRKKLGWRWTRSRPRSGEPNWRARERERGNNTDILEDRRPAVARFHGIIYNLEIAPERAAVAYAKGATANAGTELEDGASVG